MGWLVYLFVAAAGSFSAVQAGANAQLRKSLDQPCLAALCVYSSVQYCSSGVACRPPFHATGRICSQQGGRCPLVGLVGRLAEYYVDHGRPDARGEDGINVLHRHNGYLLLGLLGIARSLWLGRI